VSIDWHCLTCDSPQAESTALSEISAYAEPDADFNSKLPGADFNSELLDADFNSELSDQSNLPAEVALNKSSLVDSPTVRQNLSSSFSISFQVINNCTNKGVGDT